MAGYIFRGCRSDCALQMMDGWGWKLHAALDYHILSALWGYTFRGMAKKPAAEDLSEKAGDGLLTGESPASTAIIMVAYL